MCSLVSERRVKWTGLDKCVWLYLPWAESVERRGMACVRTHQAYFIPQLPLQPTSLSKDQITFLTSLATGLSVSVKPLDVAIKKFQVLCDTHVEETCRKFCVELICSSSGTKYQNHSCFFITSSGCIVLQLQIIRHANSMKPKAGFSSFLKIQFVPKSNSGIFCRIHSCQQTLATEKGLSHLERTHFGITLGSPAVMLYSSSRAVAQPTANFHTGLVSKCYASCPHW